MHKFNPKHLAKLDSPWRRETLPPKETLIKMGLKKGMDVADIGCGIGYLSFPCLDIIGENGKVYALDTEQIMLDYMNDIIKEKKHTNIELIKTNEYDLVLENDLVDIAILASVLHEIEDKKKFLNEIARILKDKGKLVIIEWKKEKADVGPPINHRISIDEIKTIMKETNFVFLEEVKISAYFYGLLLSV